MVRASSVVVARAAYAENANFAMRILQAMFGAGNVIDIPTKI
jgi:hypothetical protein